MHYSNRVQEECKYKILRNKTMFELWPLHGLVCPFWNKYRLNSHRVVIDWLQYVHSINQTADRWVFSLWPFLREGEVAYSCFSTATVIPLWNMRDNVEPFIASENDPYLPRCLLHFASYLKEFTCCLWFKETLKRINCAALWDLKYFVRQTDRQTDG